MSRILLADDSPHAQRMGERILREEGFEVAVTDGETALIRLKDVDPDVVLADVFLPIHSGYEICEYVKSHARHKHARVVLLAGLLEPVDEAAASRVGSDAVLKKPFEASVVVALVRPLAEAAQAEREARGEPLEDEMAEAVEAPVPEPVAAEPEPVVAQTEPEMPAEAVAEAMPAPAPVMVVDAERIRAAVTVALDRAMPAMIDEITERVLVALGQ
ncbi:MAG TPA: response regulator [Bryobacteraceae bacterium]|nr:response regulator [Bryobacteraceae bacterium]